MLSKKRDIVGVIALLGVLTPLTLLPRFAKSQGQSPAIEVSCPAGATALPQAVITNPANGKVRQLICFDASGNIIFPSTAQATMGFSGTTLTLGNSSQGGALNIQGAGGSGTISFSGGLQVNSQLLFLTTTFASLGSVPAAGNAKFCTDCTTAATCAGAGSGHLAVSNGTNWTCQ